MTGQKTAVDVITRSLISERVGHAYLFSGPRGCGKTTVARLLAKAVNCQERRGAEPCNRCESCRAVTEGRSLDVVEIDGASNNTVDEIRELKASVGLASFGGSWKVYIIDEVHMLSQSAFNALLKTLEEPPERVMFVLATTEPHKVPSTVRSRCQHIPFHGMAVPQIAARLDVVARAEGLSVDGEALWEIARCSDGGMRDGLSLLEQSVALGDGAVTMEAVQSLMGGGTSRELRDWIALCGAEPAAAQGVMEAMIRAGASPDRLVSGLFDNLRNLWLLSRWGEKGLTGDALSDDELAWLRIQAPLVPNSERLESLLVRLAALVPQIRRGLSASMIGGLLVLWTVEALSGHSRPAVQPSDEVRSTAEPLVHPAKPATTPAFEYRPPASSAGGTTRVASGAVLEPSIVSGAQVLQTEESPTRSGAEEKDIENRPAAVEPPLAVCPPRASRTDASSNPVIVAALDRVTTDALESDPVLWAVCRVARFRSVGENLIVELPDDRQVAWEAMSDRRLISFRERLRACLDGFTGHVTVCWRSERMDDEGLESLESEPTETAKKPERFGPSRSLEGPAPAVQRSETSSEAPGNRSLLSLLAKLPQADLLSYRREDSSDEDDQH